jgi:hypothetical protein
MLLRRLRLLGLMQPSYLVTQGGRDLFWDRRGGKATDFRSVAGSCKSQFSGCLGGKFASANEMQMPEADANLWSFLPFCR